MGEIYTEDIIIYRRYGQSRRLSKITINRNPKIPATKQNDNVIAPSAYSAQLPIFYKHMEIMIEYFVRSGIYLQSRLLHYLYLLYRVLVVSPVLLLLLLYRLITHYEGR